MNFTTQHLVSKSLSSKQLNKPSFIKSRMLRAQRKTNEITSSEKYEIVSHGIVYFTMFYCTLNWNYYRRLRKKMEDNDKNE